MNKVLVAVLMGVISISCIGCNNINELIHRDGSSKTEVIEDNTISNGKAETENTEVELTDAEKEQLYKQAMVKAQQYVDNGNIESAINFLESQKKKTEYSDYITSIESKILEYKEIAVNKEIEKINNLFFQSTKEGYISDSIVGHLKKLKDLRDEYPEFSDKIQSEIDNAVVNDYNKAMEALDILAMNGASGTDIITEALRKAIDLVNEDNRYSIYIQSLNEREQYIEDYIQLFSSTSYMDTQPIDYFNSYNPQFTEYNKENYTSRSGDTYSKFWALEVADNNSEGIKPYIMYDFSNKHERVELLITCSNIMDAEKYFYLEIYADDTLVATTETINSYSGIIKIDEHINNCKLLKLVAIRTDNSNVLTTEQPSLGIVSIKGYTKNIPEFIYYTPAVSIEDMNKENVTDGTNNTENNEIIQ
ncbi:MAG: hypothetical protein J6A59_12265 [Lachnospiraceae bacterium]|nr:hypothetical protein [Lachnospiraceae bacterium]